MHRNGARRIINQLAGAVQATRPISWLQAGVFTLEGTFLSEGKLAFITGRSLSAALAVMLAVAASFAFNDWTDAAEDRIGHPERAIPSGRLSQAGALGAALGLAVLAVVAAWRLGPAPLSLVIVNLLVSALYSLHLKGTLLLGNAAIAYLNATILMIGGMAASAFAPVMWPIAALVFLFTLVQEVLFSIRDRAADAQAGVRTTAVRLGRARSLRLFFGLTALFLIACLAAAVLARAPGPYLIAVGVFFCAPFGYILVLLRGTVSDRRIARACVVILVPRVASLIPLLLL